MKLFMILGVAVSIATANAQDKTEFTSLFDGKDTGAWENPFEWGEISVVDGEIHLKANKKFFIVTKKKYKNFVFEAEVKLPEGKANSGFMFRANVKKNKVFGYQAEVDGSDRCWSGGLYDEGRRGWIWPSKKGKSKDETMLAHSEESQAHFAKPEVKGALKRNDWNLYRITCNGNKLKIEVNGVLTTDFEDDADSEGPVGIQHHGEKGQVYKFRNLKIKELP